MLTSAITIYLMVTAFVYFTQRALLYLPQKTSYEVDAATVEFNSDNLVLKGWVINEGNEDALLYYGGNAENIEYNIPEFKQLLSDYTIYLVPYRGYGNNEGQPTEMNLYKDALAIYDRVKDRHKTISLIGRSLGSGVATYVAANRDIKKLVLVTPYDSMTNVAKKHYWWLPVSLLMKDNYESWRRAGEITASTLLIAAAKDRIIPLKHTEKLAEYFRPGQVTTKIIEDADHNSLSMYSDYYKNIREFL